MAHFTRGVVYGTLQIQCCNDGSPHSLTEIGVCITCHATLEARCAEEKRGKLLEHEAVVRLEARCARLEKAMDMAKQLLLASDLPVELIEEKLRGLHDLLRE